MSYEDTPCFSVNRYTLTKGDMILTTAPAIYIVSEGEGELVGEGYKRRVKKGSYFYLPYAAMEQCRVQTEKSIQLVECLPALV